MASNRGVLYWICLCSLVWGHFERVLVNWRRAVAYKRDDVGGEENECDISWENTLGEAVEEQIRLLEPCDEIRESKRTTVSLQDGITDPTTSSARRERYQKHSRNKPGMQYFRRIQYIEAKSGSWFPSLFALRQLLVALIVE